MRGFGRSARWARRTALASLATSSLVACAIFNDLDGFSGGAGEDASSDRADGSLPETSGPSLDASVVDAVTDATEVDADPCVVAGLQTRICDRFDRTTLVGPWDRALASPGHTPTIDVDPTTTSRALRTMIAGVDGGFSQSALDKALTLTSRVVMRADVRLAVPPDTKRQILYIPFTGTNDRLFIDVESTQLAFVEQVVSVGSMRHPLSFVPTPNTWFRISVDVDRAAGRATVLVNGTLALPAGEAYALLPSFKGTAIRPLVGMYAAAAPTAATEIWFDNVVVATD